MVRLLVAVTGMVLCSLPLPVWAAETITYTYDGKGRLVTVVRTGSVNNGVSVAYEYEKADNRKNVTTTGSTNSPP